MTAAKPVVTGTNQLYIYADAEPGSVPDVQLNGSEFQGSDSIGSAPGLVLAAAITNSSQLVITLGFDTPHTSPGFDTITVTSPDGSSSSSIAIPFIGNQNLLALSASGELYFLDRAAALIRQYKADGTPDGTTTASIYDSDIAADDKTSSVLLDQTGMRNIYVLGKENVGDGNPLNAIGARNGSGCATELTTNLVSCVDLTLPASSNPSFVSTSPFGSQPSSFAMGVFGTETDAFVLTRNGTPTLWKVNVSGGMNLSASQSVPGITPWSTLQANNPFAGGWQVEVFDSGPASGTVAVLSTADNLLTFLNASSMAITKQVTLSGIPFRIAKDQTNGNLIVAYADSANVRTTFAKVSPTSGVVTPLTSTATGILAVGFRVSSDGTSLYACQRAQCVVLANQ